MLSLKTKIEDLGVTFNDIDSSVINSFRTSMAGLAKTAQAEWVRIAQSRLTTSREDYVNGLQQSQSFKIHKVGGESVYEISLVGDMPNNIEFGMPAFDMKSVRPGWLGGAKAKTSKDGHSYVTIPFRHSTTSGARIQYSGKALSDNLKQELQSAVKKYGMNDMVRSSSGKVIQGPVKRIPSNAPDVHSYLKGLTKIQKAIGGKTKSGKGRGSSQFFTWRVMSEKSHAGSWLHPGLTAKNILKEVETWTGREMDKIIDSMLGAR